MGISAETLRTGTAGALMRASRSLTIAGVVGTLGVGRRHRILAASERCRVHRRIGVHPIRGLRGRPGIGARSALYGGARSAIGSGNVWPEPDGLRRDRSSALHLTSRGPILSAGRCLDAQPSQIAVHPFRDADAIEVLEQGDRDAPRGAERLTRRRNRERLRECAKRSAATPAPLAAARHHPGAGGSPAPLLLRRARAVPARGTPSCCCSGAANGSTSSDAISRDTAAPRSGRSTGALPRLPDPAAGLFELGTRTHSRAESSCGSSRAQPSHQVGTRDSVIDQRGRSAGRWRRAALEPSPASAPRSPARTGGDDTVTARGRQPARRSRAATRGSPHVGGAAPRRRRHAVLGPQGRALEPRQRRGGGAPVVPGRARSHRQPPGAGPGSRSSTRSPTWSGSGESRTSRTTESTRRRRGASLRSRAGTAAAPTWITRWLGRSRRSCVRRPPW